jgi:peptidoglycan hydrolase-like protein with peptidoglycan-binding domain
MGGKRTTLAFHRQEVIMKTSTIALLALGALATVPAWAQQAGTTRSTTTTTTTTGTGTGAANPGMSGVTTTEQTWRSPGDPAGAAQTTQAYVPNREVVSAVEQRLSQLGYNVTPDGQYDADLRNNVLLFQSDHGLRPTGNVDLATIGALGINIQPVGTTTAMAPATVVEEVAVLPPGYEFPLERTEHMSAPQVMRQSEQLETTTGLKLSDEQLSAVPYGESPPAFPPGFPVQDIINCD